MFSLHVHAQSINSTTQNSTGTAGSSLNGYNMTYSVGELASIQHYTASNNFTLSTGFLQSFTPLVTALNDLVTLDGISVSIYPNPTTQYIQILTNFNIIGQVQIQLMDAESKIKYRSEPNIIFNQFNKQLDIGEYASGIYYLRIQFQPNMGQTRVGVYKLVKL